MSAQHTDHPAPAPKDDGLAWERCPEHGPDCRGAECPGARDHRPVVPPEKRWTERPGPHPADPPGFVRAPAAPAVSPELAERARAVGLERRRDPGEDSARWMPPNNGLAMVWYGWVQDGRAWLWCPDEVTSTARRASSEVEALSAAVEWLEARELEDAKTAAKAAGLYLDDDGDWRYPNGWAAAFNTRNPDGSWKWLRLDHAGDSTRAPSEAAALRAVLAALSPPAASVPTTTPTPAPAEEPAAGKGGGEHDFRTGAFYCDHPKCIARRDNLADYDQPCPLLAPARDTSAAPDPRDARIAELEASVAFAQRENQRLAEAHAAEAARLRARGESLGRDLAASRAEAARLRIAAEQPWPGGTCPECGETERRLEEARHARDAAKQEAEGLRAKVKHLQTGLAFWRGAAVWESRGGAR